MSTPDRRFFLRLNADEFPYIRHDAWLVSGQPYRGRYLDEENAAGSRRRVRVFDPDDANRSVVLCADQLEPDTYPW